MSELSSVLVALDGPSKCGKTTITKEIAAGAALLSAAAEIVMGAEFLDGLGLSEDAGNDLHSRMTTLQEGYCFRRISTLSAGNLFRAATLHVLNLEADHIEKQEFLPEDVIVINGLLKTPNIIERLQNDQRIGGRVSDVSRMAGIQALCGTLFAEMVVNAYHANDGASLVIADARDPVGHLIRNGKIGSARDQIRQETVLSLYVDTPPDVAAEREDGGYEESLDMVNSRRRLDAERHELPVIVPAGLIDDYSTWVRSLNKYWTLENGPPTYRLNNGREVDLDQVTHIGDIIGAHLANDIALLNGRSETSVLG